MPLGNIKNTLHQNDFFNGNAFVFNVRLVTAVLFLREMS